MNTKVYKIHKRVADRIVENGRLMMDRRGSKLRVPQIPAQYGTPIGNRFYSPEEIAAWLRMEVEVAQEKAAQDAKKRRRG